jgi:hypothetical protein
VTSADRQSFIQAFVYEYGMVHRTIREEITGLDVGTLNWTPCEGANSIAVLVSHLIGSEIEAIQTVAGLQSDRIRSKEFEVRGADAAALLSLVDRADAVLNELTLQIGDTQLASEYVRRGSLDQTPRRGVHQLLHSLAHAREHVGQLMLTRQLAAARA